MDGRSEEDKSEDAFCDDSKPKLEFDMQGCALLDYADPLMLEELIDNEPFKEACDEYFSSLGYANIFTLSPHDLPQHKKLIRETFDTIYN